MFEGKGWVFYDKKIGATYSVEHPIESGDNPEAQDVRKSTIYEDQLFKMLSGVQDDCAEAYQIVGSLANMAGVFESREVEMSLNNLLAAATGEPRPHLDLLPFNPRVYNKTPINIIEKFMILIIVGLLILAGSQYFDLNKCSEKVGESNMKVHPQ